MGNDIVNDVLIVGGGPTAVAIAIHLIVRWVKTGTHARLFIVEKSGKFGPGLPFSTTNLDHLCNTRAGTMGVVPDDPCDFQDWMCSKRLILQDPVPRRVYAVYLRSRLAEFMRLARDHGILVHLIPAAVTAVNPTESGVAVTLNDGRTLEAGKAVLCLGHVLPNAYAGFDGFPGFFSPWPAERLSAIPHDAPVTVLGTGLTAIDSLWSLRSAGHRGQVTVVSRDGRLPKVQSPPPLYPYVVRHLTRESVERLARVHGHLSLTDVFGLLVREIEEAEGGPLDWESFLASPECPLAEVRRDIQACDGRLPWQDALYALDSEFIWSLLPQAERVLFDPYRSAWAAYRHPMPLQNARKLEALLADGQLEVRGGLKSVSFDALQGLFVLRFDGQKGGVGTELTTKYLVNAVGSGLHLGVSNPPLISQMLADGLMTPDPSGGVAEDLKTRRLVQADGTVAHGIYVAGDLTRGGRFFTNVIKKCVKAAADIARHITDGGD